MIRQQATTIDGIRADHVARYLEAAKLSGLTVIDAGCGVGYGAYIMATAGMGVFAFDEDEGAIQDARKYFAHERITHETRDNGSPANLLVAFELIEHMDDPGSFLSEMADRCAEIICSVPNEDVVPFGPRSHPDHRRHYTPAQLRELLTANGWRVTHEGHQRGKTGPDAAVVWGHPNGRTVIMRALSAR